MKTIKCIVKARLTEQEIFEVAQMIEAMSHVVSKDMLVVKMNNDTAKNSIVLNGDQLIVSFEGVTGQVCKSTVWLSIVRRLRWETIVCEGTGKAVAPLAGL